MRHEKNINLHTGYLTTLSVATLSASNGSRHYNGISLGRLRKTTTKISAEIRTERLQNKKHMLYGYANLFAEKNISEGSKLFYYY
jgi:hypothetical protein